MNGRYAAAETLDRPEESILELTDGENPLSILSMDEPDTALGVIAWMDDPDRIEGWRRAEIESDGEPRKVILKALAKQERALEADATLPVYHDRHRRSTTIVDAEPETPETPTGETTDPVAATDGGQTVSDSPEPTGPDRALFEVPCAPTPLPTTPEDADEETPERADEPLTHPDATALEAGRALVVELETEGDDPSATEYVWPAEPDADQPYILEIHDDDAAGPTRLDLSKADLFERVRNDDPDERPLGEIDVQAPADAATNGGAE